MRTQAGRPHYTPPLCSPQASQFTAALLGCVGVLEARIAGGLHLRGDGNWPTIASQTPQAAPRLLGRHLKGLVERPHASAPFLSAGPPASPGCWHGDQGPPA